MLPRERAEKLITLGEAGWSVQAIADQLGHSQQTVRAYLTGRTKPGARAPRASLLTDLLGQLLPPAPRRRPSPATRHPLRRSHRTGIQGKPINLLPGSDPAPTDPTQPCAGTRAGQHPAGPSPGNPPGRIHAHPPCCPAESAPSAEKR